MTLVGGVEEGRLSVPASQSHVGAVLEQQPHHVGVPVGAGQHQSALPVLLGAPGQFGMSN